jgi:mRNA interferase RelE/StbE
MIRYAEEILKLLRKGQLPKETFLLFNNAFLSIDLTKDLNLFDIKTLKEDPKSIRKYYRLRKGKYRSIFYIENEDIFVIAIDKREEVYKKWQ